MHFMKVAGTVLPYRWTMLLCILAGGYAVTVMTYIFVETEKPLGARDFHQFWYAGQFIIQGRDPYEAFFAGEQPTLPIAHLDGIIVERYPVAQPDLEITPSNTPAMLLLLTPLAYLFLAKCETCLHAHQHPADAAHSDIDRAQDSICRCKTLPYR